MASALEILLGLGATYGAYRRGSEERKDRRLQRDYYRQQRDAAEADRQQRRRDEIAQPVERLADLYPTAAAGLIQRGNDIRRGTFGSQIGSGSSSLVPPPFTTQGPLPFTTPPAATNQRSGSLLSGVTLGPSRYEMQQQEQLRREDVNRTAAERAEAVRGGIATFGALTNGRVGADPNEIARLGQSVASGKPLQPNAALLGRTEAEVDSERRTAELKAREQRDRQNQRLRIAGGLITSLKGVNDNYRQTLSTVLAQGGDVSDQLSTFLRQGGILPPSILADIARWQADPDPNAPLPRSLQQLAGFDALVDQSGGAPPPPPIAPPPLTGAGPRPGGLNPTLWNNLTSSGSSARAPAGPPPADPPPSARRELFPQGTDAQSRMADRPIGRQIQQQRVDDQRQFSGMSAEDRLARIELERQRLAQQKAQQVEMNADRDASREIQRKRLESTRGRGGRTGAGSINAVTRQRIHDADADVEHARSLWADFVKQNPFDAPEWIKYPADMARRQRLYSDVASGKNTSTDHHYAASILKRIELAERAAQAERERAGVVTGPPAPPAGREAGKAAVRSQYEQMGVAPAPTTPPARPREQAGPPPRPTRPAASSGFSAEKRAERLDAIRRFKKRFGEAPTPEEQNQMFRRIEERSTGAGVKRSARPSPVPDFSALPLY